MQKLDTTHVQMNVSETLGLISDQTKKFDEYF